MNSQLLLLIYKIAVGVKKFSNCISVISSYFKKIWQLYSSLDTVKCIFGIWFQENSVNTLWTTKLNDLNICHSHKCFVRKWFVFLEKEWHGFVFFFSDEGCYTLNHSIQHFGWKKGSIGKLVDEQSVTSVELQNCCWCKMSSNCISVS